MRNLKLASERKLDIFNLLAATDKGDTKWLSKQSPEAQKEFAPVVAIRWLSTVSDGPEAYYMLLAVNERVNVNLFDLYKHPVLVFKLMASCGTGKTLRHQWISGHKRKSESNKAYAFLESQNIDLNAKEIDILMGKYTKATFQEFVDGSGLPTADVKEIMKAYNKLNV